MKLFMASTLSKRRDNPIQYNHMAKIGLSETKETFEITILQEALQEGRMVQSLEIVEIPIKDVRYYLEKMEK